MRVCPRPRRLFPRPSGACLFGPGLFGPGLLLVALLALAGCDSPSERAESHYQRALALLAEGDETRAMLEFRNVFRLDGAHTVARLRYAELLRARGEDREAFSQLLRLAEQDPKNLEGQRALTALALEVGDFDTAALHAAEAYGLAPADPEVRALKATVDFRKGDDRPAAVAMAAEVVDEKPGSVAAQMVLVADRLAAGAPVEALARIDAALAHAGDDEGLHLARLATLEALGDEAGTGAELGRMLALFPANDGIRAALVQWHLGQGDPDAAEAVLRAAVDAGAVESDPQRTLTLVRFLNDIRGPGAARAELDRLIADAADPRPFRRARAALDFAEGDTDAAIAAMRGLVEGAAPSDQTRDLQTGLAGMLAETGEAEASAALLEAVLAEDRDHVGALKLRAKLAIDADRPEQAVQDMRTALAQAPRDAEALTVMALAYERQGARELAGEQLARAVEAADRGQAESIRYARYLMQDDRTGPAEGVVVDALRRAPEDRELLTLLGEIHVTRRDWPRVAQVATLLRAANDPAATAMATGLEAASLQGQGRTAETLELLQELAESGTDAEALAALVRGRVETGDPAAARASLDAVLANDPGNPAARLLEAGLAAVEGDAAAAEAGYRALIADQPGLAAAHQAWFAFLAAEGRSAEAAAALEAGLAAVPGDTRLLFAKAGLREAEGDPDAAIALYEQLYAEDPGASVIANNLASLLATARGDPASLERAFGIARRLRSSEVPPFQDTYGWILHLRGDSAQALHYLVPATEALPGNAQVQFHRAEAEFALQRWDAAAASFDRALAAVAAGSPLPEVETARSRRAAIAAMPTPEGESGSEPGADGG